MENINDTNEIKNLKREINILRWQNDRLLKYLRSNKIFYKKRLDDLKERNKKLNDEIDSQRLEIISLAKEIKQNEHK